MKGCTNCSSKEVKGGCKSKGNCSNSCDKLGLFDWLANIESPHKEPSNYIEVRFKNDRKDFYENTKNLPLQAGDCIAVEGTLGYDIGMVSLKGELVRVQMRNQKKKSDPSEEIKKVFRKATTEDIKKWEHVRGKEPFMLLRSKQIIKELGLKMKLSDVEYQGDGSKAVFYYTAEERVDFRKLIRTLGSLFRVSIEMRQIGYRQEASKIGGIGSCGRELCCSTWLKDFRIVNTSAARYQQLSINTQKLTGQCGKLKCCLNFELETYLDAIKDFPSEKTKLYTENEIAQCVKIDILKKEMWFSYVEKPNLWFRLGVEQTKGLIEVNQKGGKIPPLEKISIEKNPRISADLENFQGGKEKEFTF